MKGLASGTRVMAIASSFGILLKSVPRRSSLFRPLELGGGEERTFSMERRGGFDGMRLERGLGSFI
jgi:hypothetical protein